MPIIAPISRDERRLMQKAIHKTRDKNHARRLTAMLMLHRGERVSDVSGNSKSSVLFISLLKHLKATYRRAKTITRNHQCRSMWQLLKKIRHFMETASPFPGRKHGLAKV